MSQETAISIHNLTVSYHQRLVLRGITTEIPKGKLVTVIGPNGAGKSTLFKAILGLIPRDTGYVSVLGDREIRQIRRHIAYIPQKELVDWDFPVVVQDVVAMGRYQSMGWFRGMSDKDRAIIAQAMQEVGISDLARRHIRLLSGGQQQRVFIARALVQEAEILFMDEPFVGVDATTQTAIFTLMDKLKGSGKTMVIINHDLGILNRFDSILMLNKNVIAIGPPDKVYTETNIQRTYGVQTSMVEQAENSLWNAKQ
jgi:manganese/zinc/iron transport system ATP- binding protein